MSGATTALAVAAVAGTAYNIYSGERAADAQKKAQAEAKTNALKQEKAADEAFNAANRKKPDTMLTGPMGVDPKALTLGKNTLLGQ